MSSDAQLDNVELLTNEQMFDLRSRILAGEEPTKRELQIAILTLRQRRVAPRRPANVKQLDMKEIFGDA